MNLKPIEEQVVVVVGAASEVGCETALRLAKRGAKVVVSDQNESELESVIEEIRGNGVEVLGVTANVNDFDQVKTIAEVATARYGHLDTWVHLTQEIRYNSFQETKPEEFDRLIRTNLVSQAYGAMAALPHLKHEGRGGLIYISSVGGLSPFPLISGYAASKYGMRGFLDALRAELEYDEANISVAEVIPAGVSTPLHHTKSDMVDGNEHSHGAAAVADAIVYAAEHPVYDIIACDTWSGVVPTQVPTTHTELAPA